MVNRIDETPHNSNFEGCSIRLDPIAAEKQHISLNLEEKQYEHLAKVAMVLDRHLTVQPQATQIRIVVRDAGSGTFGSVSIPATAFFQAEAVAPEKKP